MFFQPFETKYFHLSLDLELRLNEIAEKGNRVFDDFLFQGMTIETENLYIQKALSLFPYLSELKGNLDLLRDMLKIIFLTNVDILKDGLSLFVVVHKRRLVKGDYFLMDEEVAEFFDFFTEWFLPIEADFDFRIKDYKEDFTLGSPLLLDYNTHFYL